ncbi:uncharacterized protein [Diabrotica undecimpunctata]|uniref:uncharacterized protein n=1 Tax=Diabrotica undecimpunctata TaxID=50387 RepID=UPI003B63A4B7
MEIDQELLITLVQNKPVLWDKTTDEYKDKRLTFEAWRDICKNINPTFEELPDTEKNTYGKLIMKKWSNIRDSFIKYHKKMMNYKSGSQPKYVRKYIYYDQMQFLIKIIQDHSTSSNMEASAVTERKKHEKQSTTNRRKRKKTEELNEVDEKSYSFRSEEDDTQDFIENENSRIMHFFRGIAPTIDSFCDDDIVDFQYEVLKIVRHLKEKRKSFIYESQYPQWIPQYCRHRPHSQAKYNQSYGNQLAAASSSRPDANQIETGRRSTSQISKYADTVNSPSTDSLFTDEFDFAATSP